MAITNNQNPMTPSSTVVPPIPPYAGGGGILIGLERLGGNGRCFTTAANTNTRLSAQQGAYLVKSVRIQACSAAGVVGDPAGTVTYGRPGLGPEFSAGTAPLGTLPVELKIVPNTPAEYIDLYNVWISSTTGGDGVVWDCQT